MTTDIFDIDEIELNLLMLAQNIPDRYSSLTVDNFIPRDADFYKEKIKMFDNLVYKLESAGYITVEVSTVPILGRNRLSNLYVTGITEVGKTYLADLLESKN
ncbi:MAG: hypothetical protein U0N74_08350 [Peptococcaceae bacterium]|jgi:hypothetical protein|nr:MAG TPA: Guanylate kinase [Caudoviricetes sp.]